MRKTAGQIPENPDSLVCSIIRKVIGQDAMTFEQIVGRGFNNAVTVAGTSSGRFVVRTNVESHLFRFQREAWCLRELSARGVLVPEVFGCGIEGDHSYSVARFVEGSPPIHSGIDQLRVWKTLGEYAAILNSIGEEVLDEDMEIRNCFSEPWEKQISSDVELIFRDDFWVKRNEIVAEQRVALQEYLLKSSHLSGPKGVCQFDITCGNALICNSDYDQIYLIDLEWVNIAPVPLYQLACIAAEHGSNSQITMRFFEGYGLSYQRVLEDSPDFHRLVLLRTMRATAWARDRAPMLLEENLRRTRPLLRQICDSTSNGVKIVEKRPINIKK